MCGWIVREWTREEDEREKCMKRMEDEKEGNKRREKGTITWETERR